MLSQGDNKLYKLHSLVKSQVKHYLRYADAENCLSRLSICREVEDQLDLQLGCGVTALDAKARLFAHLLRCFMFCIRQPQENTT